MKTHQLKTWPDFFREVASGAKTFELRKNDRDFQVGDVLELRSWSPEKNIYTGEVLFRRVTYILNGGMFGVETGYCVMGMRSMDEDEWMEFTLPATPQTAKEGE